jgi:hypothetical protein
MRPSELQTILRTGIRETSLVVRDFLGRKPRKASSATYFYRDLNQVLANLPRPKKPAGLFVLSDLGRARTIALYYPLICVLAENGWAFTFLTSKEVTAIPTRVPAIDDLWGVLESDDPEGKYRKAHGYRLARTEGLQNDWQVSLQDAVVSCNNNDFYGLFFNKLGATFKQHGFSDVDPVKLKSAIDLNIRQADAAFSIFDKLLAINETLNIPIIVAGHEPNYPPSGVFKVRAASIDQPSRISFLEVRPGYQHYFNAGQKTNISAVSVANVTKNRVHSARCVPKARFEGWEKSLGETERHGLVQRAKAYVEQDRTGGKSQHARLVAELEQLKLKGKRIIALYGSIPYDFGHPWRDEGYVHRDLLDWVVHSCNTCRQIDDVVLLLKPHPSELDAKNFKRPKVLFFEMIKDLIDGDKVRLLPHESINAFELLDLVDLSLVWRGSVAIEAIAKGRPVIECAPHSSSSYILEGFRPRSREHYERALAGLESVECSTEQSVRAALYLEYLRSSHMLPFPFVALTWRQSKDGHPVMRDFRPQDALRADERWKQVLDEEVFNLEPTA